MRRSCSTTIQNSTPAVRTRLEALAGRPVACITADVRDVAAVRAAFHDHPIAAVIHCAGLKNDRRVGGAAARVLRRQRRRHAGADRGDGRGGRRRRSCTARRRAVYGDMPATLPIGEDAPLAPANVYGRTKRVVEDFLRDLAHANANWRIAVLRSFNAAGAHASGMLGEAPRSRPTDLVTVLARVGAGEIGEVPVYGDDWGTADGTGVRDYIHVQDLAGLHVAALERIGTRHGAMTLNGGSGRGWSVREVIAAFERACGRRLATRELPRRPGDVAAVVRGRGARPVRRSIVARCAISTRSAPTPGAGRRTAAATEPWPARRPPPPCDSAAIRRQATRPRGLPCRRTSRGRARSTCCSRWRGSG